MVLITALVAISSLTYLLLDSKESQGAAESRAEIANGANQVWQTAWSAQQATIRENQKRLDAIDQRLQTSSIQSQRKLDALDRGLQHAIQNNEDVREWAERRRPQPVLDGLCNAGYIDPAARKSVCGDSGEADR
ncbi:hypothetical protein ACTXGQ_04280 [Marinobacter sp. 1Y8]